MMLIWVPSAFELSLPIAFRRHCQPEHLIFGKVIISWAEEDSIGLMTYWSAIHHDAAVHRHLLALQQCLNVSCYFADAE